MHQAHLNRSLRDWYDLSREEPRRFLEELPTLDCGALLETLNAEIGIAARGPLRTKKELYALCRTPVPSVLELQKKTPNEQTLQWMFMHRGCFASETEIVVYRELPICCAGETLGGHGRADLLVFDQSQGRAVLVELKCATARDPLSGVVLEVLLHWIFNIQHREQFHQQLSDLGYVSKNPLGMAICAPRAYFESSATRNRKPRGDEFNSAQGWIKCLRERKNILIDLYEVKDDWLKVGPKFQMYKRPLDAPG